MFKELIALAFMLTILIPMTTVRAYDWYPPGNIDGLNYFNITNFVYGTYDYITLGGVSRSSWPIDTDTDTNVTTICSGDQVLLGNGSCVTSSGYYDNIDTDTDTNVTTICSGDNVLLGNGSCVSSSEFFDNTDTDTDTDTNVTTICSGAQILLGNGSCVPDTNYLDDTTIPDTDTNASSICDGTEVLLGNGSCYDSLAFFDDIDTDTNASSICSTDQVLLGNGSCMSSWEFFDDTTILDTDTDTNCSTSACTFNDDTLALNSLTYTGTLGINNLTVCEENNIMKVSSGVWSCGLDVSGGGGGVGLWQAGANEMYANESAGGKQSINGTGFVNYSYFRSSADLWCNTTDCYSIADFLLDIDTDTQRGNTSLEMWASIDNGTYCRLDTGMSYTNITNEPWQEGTELTNSTADIQAVAVGGEAGGTVGAIVLDNSALDDQYVLNDADDTKTGKLLILETDASAFTVQNAGGPMALIVDTVNMVLWTITLKANVDNNHDIGTSDRRYKNYYMSGYITDNVRNTTAAEIRRAYDYATNGTYLVSSWNATYSATSADVIANRTSWLAQLGNSTEEMQDVAGGMWTGNTETGVDVTYQDGDGTIDVTFDCSDVAGDGLTCDSEDLVFECSDVAGAGLSCFDSNIITNLADAQVPDDITITASGKNITTDDTIIAEHFWDVSDGLEWIKPEHISDVDDADIEGDLNTYVDVAGDEMSGNFNMTTYNITTSYTGNQISNNGTCWLFSGATGDLEVC